MSRKLKWNCCSCSGAVGIAAVGKIDISGIIIHEFNFNEIQSAFDCAIHNKNEIVKAVIKMTN